MVLKANQDVPDFTLKPRTLSYGFMSYLGFLQPMTLLWVLNTENNPKQAYSEISPVLSVALPGKRSLGYSLRRHQILVSFFQNKGGLNAHLDCSFLFMWLGMGFLTHWSPFISC